MNTALKVVGSLLVLGLGCTSPGTAQQQDGVAAQHEMAALVRTISPLDQTYYRLQTQLLQVKPDTWEDIEVTLKDLVTQYHTVNSEIDRLAAGFGTIEPPVAAIAVQATLHDLQEGVLQKIHALEKQQLEIGMRLAAFFGKPKTSHPSPHTEKKGTP